MMTAKDQENLLRLPITLKAHALADEFRRSQTSPERSKQVYLNTLAVQTVQAYLSSLQIPCNLEGSDSWNPIMQTLSSPADLIISNRGRLECRPVLPHDTNCYVPAEVHEGRLGFIAVQFDEALQEATLVGFLREISDEMVPLSTFQPLEKLFLEFSRVPEVVDEAKRAVHLGDWIENRFGEAWVAIADLIQPQYSALAFRDRGQTSVQPLEHSNPLEHPNYLARRCKKLQLDADDINESIILCVGIVQTETDQQEIWVHLYPEQPQPLLPYGLDVHILDVGGQAVIQTQARDADLVRLRFSGNPGDKFSIQVSLGHIHTLDDFVIPEV